MKNSRDTRGRFVKGSTPNNKGKSPSEETKMKISQSKKGQRASPETEFQKGQIPHNKGISMSEETKKKISEAKRNSIPWNKGKKLSAEHKENFRKANKGKFSPKKGIKLSPEHVEKLKNAIRRKPSFKNKIIRRGKDSSNWKGGVTSEIKRIRNLHEYQTWRKSIFERDDYQCKNCLIRGAYLEAHHIKKFSEHPELRFDLNNGITLCKQCHKQVRGKEQKFEDCFYSILGIELTNAEQTEIEDGK